MCDHDSRWTVYSQKDLASAVGVDPSTVSQWVRAGLPREKAGKNRHRYCIPCAVAFRLRSVESMQSQPGALSIEDELLAGSSDSPALERYRLARAKLSELELEERRESLIPRDRVRNGLSRFALILRQLGERLGQRYGPEATLSVNDALDDCQRVVDDEFGGNGLQHDNSR